MTRQAFSYPVLAALALCALPARAETTSAIQQLAASTGGRDHTHDHGTGLGDSIERDLKRLKGGRSTDASVAKLDSAVIFPLHDDIDGTKANIVIASRWLGQQKGLIRGEIASCGIPVDSLTDERLEAWGLSEYSGVPSDDAQLIQLAAALRNCSEASLVSVGARLGGVGKKLSEVETWSANLETLGQKLAKSEKARAGLLSRGPNACGGLPKTRQGLDARISEVQGRVDLWKNDIEVMSVRTEEAFAALKADLKTRYPAAADRLTEDLVKPFALDYWNGFDRMGALEDQLALPRGTLSIASRHELLRQLGWRPNHRENSGLTQKAFLDSLARAEAMLKDCR